MEITGSKLWKKIYSSIVPWAFLTGGYAGVAGYLISIFYELNHVKREAE